MGKRNIIEEKSSAFALSILALSRDLEEQREYVIAKQILRSGTSIGANVNEAQNAISKEDFIAKIAIASL